MIIVSRCLLGEKVRYNGIITPIHPQLDKLLKMNKVLPYCPEVEGGLTTPRDPCEIENNHQGIDVLNGQAKVITSNNQDVTKEFISGTKKSLDLLTTHNVQYAILKENSPSCGSTIIYDGSFSGNKINGRGVFAEWLNQNGITLFNEFQIEDAASIYLKNTI